MSKLIMFFVFLNFFYFIFSNRLSSQSSEKIYGLQEIETLIQTKNYNEALTKVEEFLKNDPDNLKAIKLKINVLYFLDNYKEAGDIVDKNLIKYPDDEELLYLSGLMNIARGKYKKSIDDLNKAAQKENSPILYKIYLARGIAYMNYEMYDEAMEDYNRSLSLNNSNAATYTSKGMNYYYLKDYENAIKNFETAIEMGDISSETYFNLGMSYFKINQKNKACINFQKACANGNTNSCKMVVLECVGNIP